MPNKSLKKEYELKHSYDYADFWSPEGKRFTKKTSHRRIRRRFGSKSAIKKLLADFFSSKDSEQR